MFIAVVLVLSASGAIAVIQGAALDATTPETVSSANCSLSCPNIPKHYEELRCIGVTPKGSCCPERFECPDLKSFDESKCHYRGRSFEHGDDLDEDTEAACSAACKCLELNGKAKFTCAQIECPDVFEDPSASDCVWQHQLNKCCAPKKVCGSKEIKSLAKCHLGNTEYTQGQRIYPDSHPCYSCVCGAGFDNSTRIEDNQHCTKVDCGIEIRNLDRIRKGCVPVYFGENSCCPHEYRCPQDTDEVMPSEGRSELVAETDPKMMCTFAKLTLQRTELLNSSDKCVQCTCKTPPMVECRRKPNCFS